MTKTTALPDTSKRNWVEKFIIFLYTRSRGGKYEIPSGMPISALLGEIWTRGWMAVRGLGLQPFLGEAHSPLFVGHGVSIRSKKQLQIGNGVSLHDGVRIDALSLGGVRFGNGVTLRENVIIECTGVLRFPGESLMIGNDVGISQNGFIGVRGAVKIGDRVMMGPNVTIYAENHKFDDPLVPIHEQGVTRHGITIEEDCWLGSCCIILDGVTVGKGSVIAAGCVVTKSVPPYSIVAGVPGKVLRQRGPIRPDGN